MIGWLKKVFQKDEVLYHKAKRLVVENQKASSLLLMKNLRISFRKACHFLDIMEDEGIIEASRGDKRRRVLVKLMKQK